jgi:hypothetical protein
MGAIRLLVASMLRQRAWALVALTLALGLGAAFSLTVAGGARRASTGWHRMREVTLAPDVLFTLPSAAPAGTLERVAALSSVDVLAPFSYTPVAPSGIQPGLEGGSFVGLSDDFTTTVYRPRILAGRRPLPGRIDEVTMNTAMADVAGLRVGQQVTLFSGYDAAALTDLGPVTVVGVHLGTFDVGPNAGNASLLLPAAFLEAHRSTLDLGPPSAAVRLRGGDSAANLFTEQLVGAAGTEGFVVQSPQEGSAVTDALHVQVVALWLLAGAAGVATLVAGIQAFRRIFADSQADQEVLAALGLTAAGRRALWWAPALVVGAAAAVVAVAGAAAASPLLPTGLARQVEPDPGIFVDPVTSAVGGGVMVTAVATAGLAYGWRLNRVRPRRHGWRLPVPRTGRVTVSVGAEWALGPPEGSAGGAGRSALIAVAVGITGVVAVITFSANLSHLLTTERLYGWDFDGALLANDGSDGGVDDAVAGLALDPAVTGLAHGEVVSLPIGGEIVEAFAIEQIRSSTHPTLLAGRLPAADDEVVLGAETLERIGLTVGDRVPVDGAPPITSLRIVGKAVFPELGNNGDLANGGILTRRAVDALALERHGAFALVRTGAEDVTADVLAQHERENIEAVLPGEPPRIRNMRQVGAIPLLLACFLGLLATAAIGHALVVSVRSHRRQIAVLRAFGVLGGQVHALVAVQALVTVGLGLLIGLPLGLVLGWRMWSLVASDLGILDQPVLPWVACLATGAATLVLANLVASLPARAAARLRPADILRTE